MSLAESGKVEGFLDQLKDWPPSERLRLARMILESLEAETPESAPRARSARDLLGMLRTESPPPTDEECRAILEDELTRKHLR